MKTSTKLLFAFALAASTAFLYKGAYDIKEGLDKTRTAVEKNDFRTRQIEQQLGL